MYALAKENIVYRGAAFFFNESPDKILTLLDIKFPQIKQKINKSRRRYGRCGTTGEGVMAPTALG